MFFPFLRHEVAETEGAKSFGQDRRAARAFNGGAIDEGMASPSAPSCAANA